MSAGKERRPGWTTEATRKSSDEKLYSKGSSMSARELAISLVKEFGWYVFRVEITHDAKKCDGGAANCKRVRFLDRHWAEASSNEVDVIESWDWSDANAYGIDCGKSGLVVADEDPGDNWPFTGTRVHSSGRGFHHIYEDLIGVGNAAALAPWGIDVRGVGGVIFGPGSYHPHGGYAVVNDVPPAMPPAELASAMARPRAATSTVPSGDPEPLDALFALTRLEGVYRRMEATPDGAQNDMLNKLAATAAGIWVRVPEKDQDGSLDEDYIKDRLFDSIPHEGNASKSKDTIQRGWDYGLDHPVPDALTTVELPPRRSDGVDWFLPAILPTRSYGVLSGPIGSGKSSIAGYVVADLTKAGFRVRYCVEDEPEASARERLVLLGADMSRVKFDLVPDLTTPGRIDRYAAECANDATDFVVLDLLTSANLAYEENRPEKVKQWVATLVERFCTVYGIGVLGTHHWNNNAKAGSAMARLSGAGAIAAKAEFLWSVGLSNDRTEQVWSIHARRRLAKPFNFVMEGTRHLVGRVQHPYNGKKWEELYVYTVAWKEDTERTAHQVVADAEREFAKGKTSKEQTPVEALVRFLEKPRKRPEVDEFLYWHTGERYSPQTVVDRIRDVGGFQCAPDGSRMERGKFWVAWEALD